MTCRTSLKSSRKRRRRRLPDRPRRRGTHQASLSIGQSLARDTRPRRLSRRMHPIWKTPCSEILTQRLASEKLQKLSVLLRMLIGGNYHGCGRKYTGHQGYRVMVALVSPTCDSKRVAEGCRRQSISKSITPVNASSLRPKTQKQRIQFRRRRRSAQGLRQLSLFMRWSSKLPQLCRRLGRCVNNRLRTRRPDDVTTQIPELGNVL